MALGWWVVRGVGQTVRDGYFHYLFMNVVAPVSCILFSLVGHLCFISE